MTSPAVDFAIELVESWRSYLMNIDNPDDDGEGLGHFIDMIGADRGGRSDTRDLSDGPDAVVEALGLVFELDQKLTESFYCGEDGEDPDEEVQQKARDALKDAMDELAETLRPCGYTHRLPDIYPS